MRKIYHWLRRFFSAYTVGDMDWQRLFFVRSCFDIGPIPTAFISVSHITKRGHGRGGPSQNESKYLHINSIVWFCLFKSDRVVVYSSSKGKLSSLQ